LNPEKKAHKHDATEKAAQKKPCKKAKASTKECDDLENQGEY